MMKKEVVEHFGSNRLVAEALGISTQYVHQWPEKVPEVQAARIEKITEGKLPYNLEDYR